MVTKELQVVDNQKQIEFIDQKFSVSKGINHMYGLMQEITNKEMNTQTVHAACECLGKINETINTAITAARFLNEK